MHTHQTSSPMRWSPASLPAAAVAGAFWAQRSTIAKLTSAYPHPHRARPPASSLRSEARPAQPSTRARSLAVLLQTVDGVRLHRQAPLQRSRALAHDR